MDNIKIFMIGEEKENAEHFINLMKNEGYEATYLNEELDIMSGKQRKTMHFVKKKKLELIKLENEQKIKINGLNRI